LNTEDGMLLARKQKEILDFYQGITPSFIDAIFSSNHDQPRLLNELGSDPQKYKQASMILLTMPGAPYLYYGEEIGMLGLKPDENIREPFLWDEKSKDKGRTTWIEPVYTNDKTVTPLAAQKLDPSSYFNHYKSLIALRNSHPALAIGSLDLLTEDLPKSIMAYKRKSGDQEILVLHHVGKGSVDFKIPSGFEEQLFGLGEVEMTSGNVKLGKNSSVVLGK
jgi:alpha-amylase